MYPVARRPGQGGGRGVARRRGKGEERSRTSPWTGLLPRPPNSTRQEGRIGRGRRALAALSPVGMQRWTGRTPPFSPFSTVNTVRATGDGAGETGQLGRAGRVEQLGRRPQILSILSKDLLHVLLISTAILPFLYTISTANTARTAHGPSQSTFSIFPTRLTNSAFIPHAEIRRVTQRAPSSTFSPFTARLNLINRMRFPGLRFSGEEGGARKAANMI